MTLYAFDLDGTITEREMLPLLAAELNLGEEFSRITAMTVRGELDFVASFTRRFHILRRLPLDTVRRVVADVPLNPDIEAFIRANASRCRVITGNLDCWVAPLIERLGCGADTSRSSLRDGKLTLEAVLDKGEAVRRLKAGGRRVVAVGESAGDVPMFAAADVGIAYAGVHEPASALLAVADHVVRDGASLCRLLSGL